MSVRYYFDDEDDNDNVMGGWIGKYTMGHINYSGTRVWFRSPYTLSFDYSKINTKSTWPWDDSNIQAECLQDIIDVMDKETDSYFSSMFGWFFQSNNGVKIYYKWTSLTLDELTEKFFRDNCDFNDYIKQQNIKEGGNILIDFDPTEKFWIIYEKENVIQELKQVLEECEERGIAWIW